MATKKELLIKVCNEESIADVLIFYCLVQLAILTLKYDFYLGYAGFPVILIIFIIRIASRSKKYGN